MDPSEKNFAIKGEQIRAMIPPMGACFAIDRITVDTAPVGYMYREEPDNEIDSGWRFLAGDESESYMDDADNCAVYDVNTICNYDPAIIPYLDAPIGRVEGTNGFREEYASLSPTDHLSPRQTPSLLANKH